MRNSGFEITREVEVDTDRVSLGSPCLKFTTTKRGVAVTARGVTTDAGTTSPDPIQFSFALPCLESGGGGPDGSGAPPDVGPHVGAGGGGTGGPAPVGGRTAEGGQAATEIRPRAITGRQLPGTVSISYASGLPPSPTPGMSYPVKVTYRIDGKLFTTTIPYTVLDVSAGTVSLVSDNDEAWNLAPEGAPPAILPSHSTAQMRLEWLRPRPMRMHWHERGAVPRGVTTRPAGRDARD
jgi:hypothetical protein